MASLNKLAIRGIRSFDDKQISVIEFFTPVTVIVGPNGSGKTTVIECLKYATTGDQPPNTRGGAFVHDPKMANEKEVKAQVKLRFNAANGARMLAVRNLSVTMKKNNTMTMKTLESILALADSGAEKGGKRGVISTKCAEIDTEIPHLLGVSKAVLENVIFCHQEDSYWPLAEPSILKKKFDDIFEATRYTKALDAIKALRKDRVAELKAEKERLESLSKEKVHADKLKSRISDLTAAIASKEIEYDQTKKGYEQLVLANKKFYDYATQFRELYLKIQNMEQNRDRYKTELESAKENVREVEGTEEELQARLDTFADHIAQQKERAKQEEIKRQDYEEELAAARKAHVQLINQQGSLEAEKRAQEQRLAEREELIRDLSTKYQIKGYDYSPLEKEKAAEFTSRLSDLLRRETIDAEKIQDEVNAKNKEYQERSRQLHADLERLKQMKSSLRNQISTLQTNIARNESQLDASQTINAELRNLATDMEERKARLEKVKAEIKSSNYDERIAEKTAKIRSMEEQKDALNQDLRSLSLQADMRARLDIKRAEQKSKAAEVRNILDAHNPKFRALTGADANAGTMERELERTSIEKDREIADLENQNNAANRDLQQAQSTLSGLKVQLKTRRDEVKSLDKKIQDGLDGDFSTVEAGLAEATLELNDRKERSGAMTATSHVWEVFLKNGRTKKVCKACNRGLQEHELPGFESYVKEQMKKASSQEAQNIETEMKEWEELLKKLQGLAPDEAALNRLRAVEIPDLEQQIRDFESKIPNLNEKADQAASILREAKRDIKDMTVMRQQANLVSRNQRDIERLKQEITDIETSLSATGSTKTADDVQLELDTLAGAIRTQERERQGLSVDKERQLAALRSHENDMHSMQLREKDLLNELKDKEALEARTESMQKEMSEATARLKEVDDKITEAQAPISQLDEEYHEVQNDLNVKLLNAQRATQGLNKSVDSLEMINKTIDRYVRDKRGRQLKDCEEKIENYQNQIQDLGLNIEKVRDAISSIDREISDAAASMANLRENIRIRKLMGQIKEAQAEIDSHDMEAVAKSRRNFDDKYAIEKERETDMQGKYAHLGGELSSQRAQLKQLESDLKDFKDINKKYTDQLIKVKMSDMANSDLEKYAKALDNAIMKYHSLKMEEVNDTMRHLWNKTYQGTDIDGIKIRSENEGGASTSSRKSYNYRVVMTKDQVEMDMRGRCSAGQKMLASIIIRLALSDSFGQNCGILALDEPTNALDVENIDALAASLVDIINERKNHSNFQLVIITHDENFLQKLGQCEVMEYYWRVSRDSRQKSVIERQRFH